MVLGLNTGAKILRTLGELSHNSVESKLLDEAEDDRHGALVDNTGRVGVRGCNSRMPVCPNTRLIGLIMMWRTVVMKPEMDSNNYKLQIEVEEEGTPPRNHHPHTCMYGSDEGGFQFFGYPESPKEMLKLQSHIPTLT